MAEEKIKKPKRGRPVGAKGEQRLVKYTLNLGEAVRDNIPSIYIIQYHTMRVAGINPKWILDDNHFPIGIEPDPSPLALAPTNQEKSDSLKFLSAYGWGQPVQSTQVDVEIRARIDQMGSGVSNAELASKVGPGTLKALQRLLLPQASDEVIDAEWTDVKEEPGNGLGRENTEKPSETEQLSTVSEGPEKNNPLPETDSGGSDDQ